MGLFGRYLPIVFLVTLLLILGDAFFSFSNLAELHGYETQASHSRDVLLQIDVVQNASVMMESNVREYIISGNPGYKLEYSSESARIQSGVQALSRITSDSPTQRANIDHLKQAINIRLQTLRSALAIYESSGAEGVKVMANGEGSETSQQVRNAIILLQNEEKTLLTQRSHAVTVSYHRIISGITLATILSLLLIMLAYYLATEELRRRRFLEQRKDEFISLASHELKTPITSQKVYLQLLKKAADKHDDPELQKLVSRVNSQSSRLSELVSELLDISRIQTGKLSFHKEAFDLNELLKDTTDSIQQTTRKHILKTTSAIKVPMLGDKYRLYQVFVNLLTNAIKYSPAGGKIVIKAVQVHDEAVISIKDKGIGIAKENQKKIFDRLYQVEDSSAQTYPGLGIGLFISKEIVQQHGGMIHVESQKGKGSTFIVTLPLDGVRLKHLRLTRKTRDSEAPKKRRANSRR